MIRILFILLMFFGGSIQCQAKAVKIKPKGGVFQEPFYIKMSTDSNTVIYFTVDGSIPNTQSTLYSDSILVDDVLVLRAVTYVNGKKSNINTQSYFIGRSYALPIISIV